MKRRIAALAVTLALMTGSCAAEAFSPALTAAGERLAAGGAFRLSLGARFDILSPFNEDVRAALNLLLEDMRLNIDFSQTDTLLTTRTEALLDGAALFSYAEVSGGEGLWTGFPALPQVSFSGRAADGRSAASLLLDVPESAFSQAMGFSPAALASALEGALPAVWEALAPYAKEARASKTITNAGRAARTITYTIPADETAAVWADIAPLLLDGEVMRALSALPGAAQAVQDAARTLAVSSKLTVTRYVSGEGADIGLGLSGTIGWEGLEPRKVSLTLGRGETAQGEGLSVKLSAPAVQGKDTLKITLGAVWSAEKLTAEGTLERRRADERQKLTLDATLKSSQTEAGERVTGTVKFSHLVPVTGENSTRTYTLAPDVAFAAGGQGVWAEGTLAFTRKTATRTEIDATIGVTLENVAAVVWQDADDVLETAALTDEQIAALQSALRAGVTDAVMGALLARPLEEAQFIASGLSQADWAAIVQSGMEWIVEEETP